MSRSSKVCFIMAVFLLSSSYFMNLVFGWLNVNYFLLAGAAAAVLLSVVLDRKLYFDFFTMKTTKHGMNMGLTIILMVAFLVCVNYMANRHNKTFDFTSERLNSLSDQTMKIIKGLAEPLDVKIFYAGAAVGQDKATLKQNLQVFEEASPKIHLQFINSYEEVPLASKYLNDVQDKATSPIIGFAEYKGKRIRIAWPIGEEQLTSAMIKATRASEKKIYFIQGHGERDLSGAGEEGISEFAKALTEASYKVETLNLVERDKIPEDAAMLAIVGPATPFLDQEIKLLREYVLGGGRILIAIDPGQRHNLANLTKPLGVEFANNIVISINPRISGRSQWTIAATQFDSVSDVTAPIPNGRTYAVMDLASQLRPAMNADPEFKVTEIVKSSPMSFTVNDIQAEPPKSANYDTYAVGIQVKGPKKLEAIVYGDSDFISNKGFNYFSNRDLSLNSVASLTNEADLISIRPKLPKGTLVRLTAINRGFFLIAGLGLPVVFMILGLVMWYRRRGA
jgi:ABC-type uncharacterized transport system involved in gliding motility auxiliary subunit